VHLWHGGVVKAAADWFVKAREMPGAPNWLGPLAATTMAGADRGVARVWLQEMARTAPEAWVRRIALHRLLQLQAMDQIDYLERLVPVFQKKMGRNPTGWADFAAAGVMKDVPLQGSGELIAPVDPAGTPYAYFPASGLVRLGPGSPLFPMPSLPGSPRR
jgi:hypothetical protein